MSLNTVVLDRLPPLPDAKAGSAERELLAWPSGAAWALRVGVAEIERDGPLPPRPGLQCWLALMKGDGVVITRGGQRRLMERDSAPMPFLDTDSPRAQLMGDPALHLEFDIRQSAGSGEMLAAVPDEEWVSRAAWRALFAADAATLQIDDTDVASVRAGTLVWSDHGTRQRWRVHPADPLATRAWWLAFQPAAPAIQR